VSAAVIRADARSLPLPDGSVDLICTSPPYFGLRSYTDGGEHYAGQIGSEATPAQYVAALLECTREWVRVLKPSGSMFINLGDSYHSGKGAPGRTTTDPKNAGRNARRTTRSPLDYGLDLPRKTLVGLPWRYALACMDDLGLILRAEIIWAKPNGLPESVTDRVRRSHEQVFHFTRQPRYYSAVDEVREPALHPIWSRPNRNDMPSADARGVSATSALRNVYTPNPLGKLPGSVWEIPSQPLTVPARLGVDHFAAWPMELPRRVIAGWSPPGICTACGEGRRPVVHRDPIDPRHLASNARQDSRPRLEVRGVSASSILRTGLQSGQSPATTITGYACACPQPDAPTRPAIVADPFGGTGTTALVADALGRDGLSFDRSADYGRLAKWRTTDPGERAKALQVPKPPPVMDGQDALFAL
jgi:DNA modification methylase